MHLQSRIHQLLHVCQTGKCLQLYIIDCMFPPAGRLLPGVCCVARGSTTAGGASRQGECRQQWAKGIKQRSQARGAYNPSLVKLWPVKTLSVMHSIKTPLDHN